MTTTILVIEDNPDVAQLLARGLGAASAQYHVLTAPSATTVDRLREPPESGLFADLISGRERTFPPPPAVR